MEPIQLADEHQERAIALIREYFERERDEELGQLATSLIPISSGSASGHTSTTEESTTHRR
jgi:hypothetical protein